MSRGATADRRGPTLKSAMVSAPSINERWQQKWKKRGPSLSPHGNQAASASRKDSVA